MERKFSKYNRFGLDKDVSLRVWIGRIANDRASGMEISDILDKYENGKVEPDQILAMIDYVDSMDRLDSVVH